MSEQKKLLQLAGLVAFRLELVVGHLLRLWRQNYGCRPENLLVSFTSCPISDTS